MAEQRESGNDFDRAGRHAVKLEPDGTKGWLWPRLLPSLGYRRWLDSQSAPRPGEPDRRCDTIMELIDADGRMAPWAGVIELFTEADGGALDRAVEYVGRYRGELRHGPHGRDKYQFMVALVFLTGAPPETRLEAEVPGMPECGHWFRPAVMDVSAQDAVAHLDAIEQNRLARGLLSWVALMKGGQTAEIVARWRTLAEPDERVKTLVDLVMVFSRLTDSEDVWKKGLEGLMLQRSPYIDEVREEERLKTRIEMLQKNTIDVLEARFPGAVPSAVAAGIRGQEELDKLDRWHKLAATVPTVEAFQRGMN